MKCLKYQGPYNLEVVTESLPQIGEEEVLVKVLFNGLCGSDNLIVSGKHSRAKPGLILGHEFYGEVAQVGESVNNFSVSERVVASPAFHCQKCTACTSGKSHLCKNVGIYGIDISGGIAEYCIIKANNLLKVPDNIKDPLPALLEPLAVAVHAVKVSDFKVGDSCAIIGGGPIGALIAVILKGKGAKNIIVSDVVQSRLDILNNMNFKTVNSISSNFLDEVSKITEGKGADKSFECAGVQPAFSDAMNCLSVGGTLTVVSLHKNPERNINLLSTVYNEYVVKGAKHYTHTDFEEAISFAQNNQEKLEPIIGTVLKMEDSSKAFEKVPLPGIKTLIDCR